MRTLRHSEVRASSITVLLLLLLAGRPAPAGAQSVLVREGDLVPGTDWVITSLGNTAVSGPDELVVGGNAQTSTAETIGFMLDAAGDCDAPGTPAPCVLRFEQTIGIYEQTSFESFFGVGSGGEVAYSPICTNTSTQTTGLDGVWLDDVDIAVEEQVYQNDPAQYWSFGSRPTSDGNGVIYWVGGLTDTQGGATQNRGLFMGAGATPLVIGGGTITGLSDPVSTASTGIAFDFHVSLMGTHWIAEVGTETGSTANDNAIAIDGAVALSDGSPIAEGAAVPVASGGIGGEAWDNFDFLGITESGTWMVTGDTDGAVATDEFIAIDGVIVHREGDTLDGEVLTGAMEGAFLNENGDYAYVWDIVGGTGSLEALFFGDQLLLVEGDPVDWDGDGVIDAGTAIDNFTGISALTLTDRDTNGQVEVLCTADVSIPLAAGRGTEILEGFLVVTVETGPVAVTDPAVGPRVALHAAPSVVSGAGAVSFEATLPTGDAWLAIFDVTGRRVATIFSGSVQGGPRRFTWDGTTSTGASAEAGVYWARLESSGSRAVTRLTRVP